MGCLLPPGLVPLAGNALGSAIYKFIECIPFIGLTLSQHALMLCRTLCLVAPAGNGYSSVYRAMRIARGAYACSQGKSRAGGCKFCSIMCQRAAHCPGDCMRATHCSCCCTAEAGRWVGTTPGLQTMAAAAARWGCVYGRRATSPPAVVSWCLWILLWHLMWSLMFKRHTVVSGMACNTFCPHGHRVVCWNGRSSWDPGGNNARLVQFGFLSQVMMVAGAGV